MHVITGTAAVPLLLVKLWSVFPKLVARPPRAVGDLLVHGLERVSIGVLVAAAVFQLATGLANTAQWYPWHFHFRATHYAVAWIAIGALLVHIAVKLPMIRGALTSDVDSTALDRPGMAPGPGVMSRRGLLRTTWAAAGVAVLATAGATVPWLRQVSVFGRPVRRRTWRGADQPHGHGAGVVADATSASYRLVVAYAGRETSFTLADLQAMEQTTASLPIACVEGWSAGATWTGVPVRDLLDLVRSADPEPGRRALAAERRGRALQLPRARLRRPPAHLLALRLHGEPLSLDHGFPCRLIAPDRPGVDQTKWVGRLEVAS